MRTRASQRQFCVDLHLMCEREYGSGDPGSVGAGSPRTPEEPLPCPTPQFCTAASRISHEGVGAPSPSSWIRPDADGFQSRMQGPRGEIGSLTFTTLSRQGDTIRCDILSVCCLGFQSQTSMALDPDKQPPLGLCNSRVSLSPQNGDIYEVLLNGNLRLYGRGSINVF